jgi:hypothetical protein
MQIYKCDLTIIIGVNSRLNTADYTFNNINIKTTGPDWIVGKSQAETAGTSSVHGIFCIA